jgi:hypothetical protein
MLSASLLRSHGAHFVVFGLPVAVLVSTVGWQELRGRLRERADARAGAESPVRRPRPTSDLPTDGLWVAAAGLVAAAAIHATVITEHFREYVLFGVFFVALAIAQFWLAAVLVRHPDRRTVRYVAVASVWVVALWVVSRTTGLPIGPEPWRPEAFGGLDIASSCAELITAVGCLTHLWLVRDHRRLPARHLTGLTR